MSAATDFNTPDFRGLGTEHLDGLARAVVLLTREVCVLTDRMLVMETVLEAVVLGRQYQLLARQEVALLAFHISQEHHQYVLLYLVLQLQELLVHKQS